MARTSKNFLAAVLVAFALGSIAYSFVLGVSGTPDDTAEFASLPANAELIVYYLSEGKDCTTCEHLDAYTREAIETYFAGDLASGRIVWRTADMDRPEHKHFVSDYILFTKSIVLVRVQDGIETDYKNLRGIWHRVYDKPAFIEYIRSEVEDFLGGSE